MAGESSYNGLLPGVADDLESAGVARTSAGALCVFFAEYAGPTAHPYR